LSQYFDNCLLNLIERLFRWLYCSGNNLYSV